MFRIIKCIALLFCMGYNAPCMAQSGYWQQAIDYKMDVTLNPSTHQVIGKAVIRYTNHSPDTLRRLFLHTYWNAFMPGSNMDNRSRDFGTVETGKGRDSTPRYDWDSRIKDRIEKLTTPEQGFTRITSCTMAGKELKLKDYETICEVIPDRPVLPGQSVTLSVSWESQVPVQVRRSGRYNKEGVAYTMTQWYPKFAAYDARGWHPDLYTGREFYGTWGNYTVNITLPADFKVGAGGILQNAGEIGWGYDAEGSELKDIPNKSRTWKFVANKVHDFAWAADTGFIHFSRRLEKGPILHFIFKNNEATNSRWKGVADTCAMVYPFIRENFGPYAWSDYTFIQGGDGGMEYAMATMIQNPSINTAIHEWMHSWYQHLLGTNENRYPWMDEGFTSFAEARISHSIYKNRQVPSHWVNMVGYMMYTKGKFEEPLSTPASFLRTNQAYNYGSYSKGAMLLVMLGYIAGNEHLSQIMLDYYDAWAFRQPGPDDFLKIAEKRSGLQLAWFMDLWINTTKQVNYGIDTVMVQGDKAAISIKRIGEIPMPLDIMITYSDGQKEWHYVPLDLMFGIKPPEKGETRVDYQPQKWANRSILLQLAPSGKAISKIEIDPENRLADVDITNNTWQQNR